MKMPRSIWYSRLTPASLQVGISLHAIDVGDLRGVRAALAVEDAERPQSARLPLRDRLDRIVDRRIDVAADELHRDGASAGERHVGEFLSARQPLERGGDDLVFLLRAGASHAELRDRSPP